MMAVLSQFIPWEAVAGVFLGAFGLFLAWRNGAKSAKDDAKVKDLEAYRDTSQRMGRVEDTIDDDIGLLRERMRERGQSKRGL